ncbi:c-type cytochrome [Mesorhizobium sp. M5C.F.Ca.IN.020.29.1.1]|uniref:c-type cytochrome n=1 Tax=unclassified Mesorhizobium TaxID=325217 RepID=UPI000FCAF55B|nr:MULTISPECIES: c-type cytochrome [unclassified Mesorhizobium]RUV59553.1 c-type cytochrome [Mesorhizobium sp. M5C.F.Ca.IN.020.29.1.1]TIM90691.1 MAG: c-type cytochrome [Mesorhizobium sp.]
MSHSQATTRNHVISVGVATASPATFITRARASLAALLVAGGLLLPGAASAQQADGERLFRQRCGSCHSLEPGQNRTGPHLSGVIGRKAGSVEGARYSAALRESAIVWEGRTLDTFLAAPRRMVPGTSMTVGVPNPAQRAAIIGYLEGAVAQ